MGIFLSVHHHVYGALGTFSIICKTPPDADTMEVCGGLVLWRLTVNVLSGKRNIM